MTTEVHVPALPESVADATILEWHKNPGDPVRANETLLDLETDKVVLEVPAPCDGVLQEILAKAGDTVSAETLLARIDESQAGTQAQARPSDQPPTPHPSAERDTPVAPAARLLITELGLDASQIPGSGRDGRIHKADVVAWLDRHEATEPEADGDQAAFLHEADASASTQASARAPATDETRPQQRVPMTRLRARIAERLLAAQQQTAALTTFNEVDMSAVLAVRARYRDAFEQQHGVRLGMMSFFVKAAVAALQQFPIVNATIDGNDILYHGYYDIGIAVSTERGLVVPILRDCDRLGLAEIEAGITTFGSKARDGSLSFDELTGGTFSITNGGVFGSLLSTPIVNPPQSAILGMHKVEERPVAIDGQVAIRPMMYLALSYDHRLIDGREAVRFLVAIKNAVEDPTRLLLNL
ncbi:MULTISPECIES: 2-oxoglutarate dehydrogenase complex dihydrolipoyllysine-residue succinyltransferase [Thiorhodovibrio]|uniref:2-oxoglutarate dehydrogenase complex dihydrolipoyllysine-residue succinyltransferase n=1 Tax=Thiorhodovibrio TaxID=61593 RepID=UPI001911A009|nr:MULTISPECIES: 2-oxoglutarate dehydrogenase complex dihydrolipoyllysine-residue succinyltransferase [Thiorhodovibrio]MBK5967633.1 dihydrolipoamide succinyltransferase [Thiorhodovibrio winogradskyi]WPL13062.1 Dihydrolipoyllysine-residue succinyltransferase component of 2-oxoglutarate dehydrogenase complex [Thiorhodovibrio litoralis]